MDVPAAFTLPELGSPLSHEVIAAEWTRFVPRWTVRHAVPERDDVELTEVDGVLRVHLVPDPFGGPTRWRRPPAVRIGAGQWVRWRINYRFPAPSVAVKGKSRRGRRRDYTVSVRRTSRGRRGRRRAGR